MSVKNDIYAIRDSLLDWLKEHRHGVMGTVIFHLVLAIYLVCGGISRLDSQQRMEIEIDMPEPEIVQQKQEEQKKKEQILHALAPITVAHSHIEPRNAPITIALHLLYEL